MAAVIERNLLLVVLDACDDYNESTVAQDNSKKLAFTQYLDHVMTFLNSYLVLKHTNSIAVCLCHQAGSNIVYPVCNKTELEESNEELRSGKHEPLANMNGLLRQEITRVILSIAEHPPASVACSTMLSGGLSKSLCYIQRCIRETPVGEILKPRILVIKAAVDLPAQHLAIMNCIFASQKQNIPIDSCVLWHTSGFLQQASDITGGIYINIPEPASLLQMLLWVFLPDVSSRTDLCLPSSSTVDYRAACFCHQKLLEYGFVCSVCLAIFCQFTPICPVCQSHFKLPTLPLSKPKKKKAKQQKSNKI